MPELAALLRLGLRRARLLRPRLVHRRRARSARPWLAGGAALLRAARGRADLSGCRWECGLTGPRRQARA